MSQSDLSLDSDPDVGGLDVTVYERGIHESRAVHLQLVATINLILTKVKLIPNGRNIKVYMYITHNINL